MFVIFDFDGTLCDVSHRLHFIQGKKKSWRKFFEACVDDEPKWPIINTFRAMRSAGHRVEIWSGRSAVVEDRSRTWLDTHVDWDAGNYLKRMRPIGDYTPDDELKESWLHSLTVKPDLVFDDRQRVVDMWRRNGITCAQVDAWEERK